MKFQLSEEKMNQVDEIFEGLSLHQKELIHLLHRTQARFGCIPAEIVAEIARRLRLSEAEIYGILTFYKAFTLEPRGKHQITVCLGTACHVRGGWQIAEEAERRLGIRAGETSADREYSLETVNCLGCCAIGPVVVVDGTYHSHVTIEQMEKILPAKTAEGKDK